MKVFVKGLKRLLPGSACSEIPQEQRRVSPATTRAAAFSGEGDASDQTHLYLGIALGPFKNLSAGAKLGVISDGSRLSAILVDLNGDGLLDQVMVNGLPPPGSTMDHSG